MYKNEKIILSTLEKAEPWLLILVGPPLVGKSTFIKNVFPDTTVVSRDNALMEFANELGIDYNTAFREVSPKKVNKRLNSMIVESAQSGNNVINDMTNLTVKRRRSNMAQYSKGYNKFAIVFTIPSFEELVGRNNKRNEEEGKFIPIKVLQNFLNNYQTPTKEEGFIKIWNI